MTIVSVPKDVWTLVTTASADTIVENLGHSEVFISRTAPTLAAFEKSKLGVTTVVSGDPVYIYSVGKSTDINYFAAGATVMTVTLGPFHINDIPGTATTQATQGYFNTATELSRSGVEMRMSMAGRVVGMIMTSDVGRTAGTATARVRINGVDTIFDGDSVQLSAAPVAADSSFVSYANGVAFAANDTIGAAVVTSGWTPTSANVNIYVIVMLEPF